MSEPRGTFCLVLHSHLPWVAHHGAWPVGEEWLHQAWAGSYAPLRRLLEDLAREGRRDVLTLGVTPVLAAMLDDPYSLRQHHTWLADAQLRAIGMAAGATRDPVRRDEAARQFALSARALEEFERHWSRGGSAALRPLIDAQVSELLGGPLTHSFTPLLPNELAEATLRAGLDDAALRLGTRPAGIWAPECAYAPGLEKLYAAAGVSHVVVDGPTLLHVGATTDRPWRLGESDVIAFGRDLDVTYRVWSPRRGYPGDPAYLDFHSYDHVWGFRTRRVTGRDVDPHDKAAYEPELARDAVARHVADFVDVVVARLDAIRDERHGQPGLVVAAYDTELFGHWWHEGVDFLGGVLRALPEAGVRVSTLRSALDDVDEVAVHPEPSSWGSGKDWQVWNGAPVADIADTQAWLASAALACLEETHPRTHRSRAHDQLMHDTLLALSSDWAFMVTKDSAAQYARSRFDGHVSDASALIDALHRGDVDAAERAARDHSRHDAPFGHLDARRFLSSRP
ncbi:MAG: 1,4-alpha-glucan branching protein domain-containing protein [bacterium]